MTSSMGSKFDLDIDHHAERGRTAVGYARIVRNGNGLTVSVTRLATEIGVDRGAVVEVRLTELLPQQSEKSAGDETERGYWRTS